MLILVRHGRTRLNAQGRLQGRLDEPLDEVGLLQAEAIAAHVGAVDVLISSPLQRARQTAEAFGTPFTTDERWIEISYGIFEGAAFDGPPRLEWERWRNDVEFTPEGGESLVAVRQRVAEACDELSALALDADVAVVSHVSPIKAALAWALDAPMGIAWRTYVAPAGVSRIDIRAGGPVLTSFNEVPSSS